MDPKVADVVILGGGVGGLVVANRLRKLQPAKTITLVDKSARQHFQPSYLWVANGARNEASIARSLVNLQKKRIDFVEANIQSIDPPTKTVTLDSGTTISGREGLVISLGADLRPDLVPGLGEAGLNLYSLAGSAEIHKRLSRLRGGKIVVLTAEPLYKCPAAPYEAALLIDHWLRKRDVRGATEVAVFAAEPAPMGTAGPNVSAAVKDMLAQRSIAYYPEHKVVRVDPGAKRIHFANEHTADFDLLVFVPPHRLPQALVGSDIVGPSGWIAVDKHTLATTVAGVYAIGDNVSIPLSIGKPLPKAGIFAHAQAEVVAHNLANPAAPKKFDGQGSCFIETGYHRAGMGSGDFYAEPSPNVRVHRPAILWHLGKVLFEKSWLYRWY